MTMKFFVPLAACLLFVAVATGASAQDAGRIEGRVLDIDEQSISGVTVLIREIPAVDVSDRNGRYARPCRHCGKQRRYCRVGWMAGALCFE